MTTKLNNDWSRFWIFGDSFSTSWRKGFEEFPNQNLYIEREAKDGNEIVGDFEYWLIKANNKAKLTFLYQNYAKGGNSTNSILNKVDHCYKFFKRGDVVLLQLSLNGRVATIDSTTERIIDVNFPYHPKDMDMTMYKKVMQPQLFFDFDFLEKKAVEQSSKPFIKALEKKIKFYKQAINQKGVKVVITSLDYQMQEMTDLPYLYYLEGEAYIPISSKYPEIQDRHPTYESNKLMAEKVSNAVAKLYHRI